ncbi:hypothetical protein [Sphingomonas psychrolutea]|uniref:Uncharacterized protein n=1 Tax=Sphingomonas psychrolutea TaxID=1259676 RepID=A0ABQ1G4P4_9SPHN|nr:hypothetical protein [Sphingomonas psychrolutea]GGA37365.1 hypothetical protein GCM10011395_04590 [Sphingomonas psychrolutea]
MILTIETALRGAADILRDRIAPAVDDTFVGETARLAGMLLRMNADWVDDAAAIRVAENAVLRALFADARSVVSDASLAARLAEAAQSGDPGLRVSELDRESNRLRGLLTDLHLHVEASDRSFDQRIWRLLEDFEAARAPR